MADRPSSSPLHPLVLAFCVVGCSALPPAGSPENALAERPLPADRIRWPDGYVPEKASFFVTNSIEIAAAPDVVWDELVRAEEWPSWYEGAENVRVRSNDHGVLDAGSVFSWSTMGLDFESRVTEFSPPHRLSWESRKSTIQGYHAWLVIPTETGVRLVTEESQHGFLTLMQKIFVPNKLHDLHDVWLAKIKERSERVERARLGSPKFSGEGRRL